MKKEKIKYGPINLKVRDIKVSTNFWESVIGLYVRKQEESITELGTEKETILILNSGASDPFQNGYSGLYHLALHVPNESELALFLARFIKYQIPISPTDHIMSKAIYLNDPDGITIEITLETPERFKRYNIQDGKFEVITSNGEVKGAVEPLDTNELLNTLKEKNFDKKVPSNLFLGHVHLYVSDLEETYNFYKKLGFIDNLLSKHIGFADLSAGGKFKHRIAMNTWQSLGSGQAPQSSAGMNYFEIKYNSENDFNKAISNVGGFKKSAGKYITKDPSGNTIYLSF